jgi:hypothetical protein
MALTLPRREATRIQAQHCVVEALQAALALFHQLGLEAAVAVSGHDEVERPTHRLHRLVSRTVASVAIRCAVAHVRGIAEVGRQLRVQRSFHKPLRQVLQ